MNNGPRDFKTMRFPPARDGTNAIAAPLPPPPPPRTLLPTEVERRAFQLKEMKKFVEAQRCPMCNGQLDGIIGFEKATLYCVVGGEQEYKVIFNFGLSLPYRSVSTYYTTLYAYEVDSRHINDELYENKLYKIDLSLNLRFQQADKECLLTYEGKKFHLDKSLDETQLLNKIKLYTLFS